MASEDDFSELLQEAEQLTVDMDANGELPRVQRNLRQVLETGQQLWSRTAQGGVPYTKASILLGAKGLDLPRLSQKLESLSTTKTFEPLEPTADVDIHSFLKNERENAILSVIEDTRSSTFQYVDQLIWDTMQTDWNQKKRNILNSLIGFGDDLDLTTQPERSLLADPVLLPRCGSLNHMEMAYAEKVHEYNEAVVQGGLKPNLTEQFMEASKKMDDKNVSDMWEMVRYMTEVPLQISDDPLKLRNKPVLQNSFISNGRRYLQDSYKKYLQSVVFSNLQHAQLGGIPGTYPLVRSFVAMRSFPLQGGGLEDGLVDGQPVWPLIYYCMRCGDLQAALQVARKASSQLDEFTPMLEEYYHSVDHRLSHSSENKVRLEYRRSIRNSTDPFKKIVHCILGCCDVNEEHSDVATTTDDYLWVKLSQLREEGEEEEGGIAAHVPDRFTYAQFQKLLLEEYGEAYFNAHQQPYLYFQVLFLTSQFEAACAFLAELEVLQCHAVHVALALHERNLLALPVNMEAPLLSRSATDPPSTRRLNLSRLVMLYTRKFEVSDPQEALNYFYFLRSVKSSKGDNLFSACVSELVRESREFDLLLGRMEDDGCRSVGLIDKFHGVQVDISTVIETVARDSENKGMHEDAIKLYDLCKNHGKVVSLLNQLLSQAVPDPPLHESARDRYHRQALQIARRYQRQGCTAPQEDLATFHLLLDLVTFFDDYHSQKHEDALRLLKGLSLVPLSQEEVEPMTATFRNLSNEVRRNLPDLLLATMDILHTKYKRIKSGVSDVTGCRLSDSTGKDMHLTSLRSQARALIVYAGMIPFRMPGDTNSRLVQLEILMN